MEDQTFTITAAIGVVTALVLFIVAYFTKFGRSNSESNEDGAPSEEPSHAANGQAGTKRTAKAKTKAVPVKPGSAYSHPWLATSLKGHSGRVLDVDFSSNGKYLVTCSDD